MLCDAIGVREAMSFGSEIKGGRLVLTLPPSLSMMGKACMMRRDRTLVLRSSWSGEATLCKNRVLQP